jgi:hypothetical protein
MTRQSAARRGEDNPTVAREERKDAGSRCASVATISRRAARRAHHGRRGGAAGAVTVVEMVDDVLALEELDARALCAGERRRAGGGGRQTRRGDGQQGEVGWLS